jgi:hypothetical protein
MEAPGRLADKEDSMPSTSRTAAALFLLTVLLGLYTVPAQAQPQGAQAGDRIETKVLEEVWHWLTYLWASSGTTEHVQKAPMLIYTNQSTSDFSLNRGGAYDPNGHS